MRGRHPADAGPSHPPLLKESCHVGLHACPVLETAAAEFAAATANPPYLSDLGPAEGRKTVNEVQSGEIAKPQVDEGWITVSDGPTGSVRARIVRPAGATGTLPVILYIHGAGWVFGNAHTHDRLVRELATGVNAAVVFPEYDLSPEARYPIAIEQNYALAQWVVREGSNNNLDASRIAVAGDSVGGNMSAALTLMAKERGDVPLVQQVLFYPVTDASFDTGSYHQFAEGYFLRRDGMQWFWNQYTTDPAQRAEITASPLRATTEQLTGLPPALIITSEADVLRDKGEAYANKLRAVGVPVTATRYPLPATRASSTASSCSTPSAAPKSPKPPSPRPPPHSAQPSTPPEPTARQHCAARPSTGESHDETPLGPAPAGAQKGKEPCPTPTCATSTSATSRRSTRASSTAWTRSSTNPSSCTVSPAPARLSSHS
ncbi:alpha/beta hydrolase [Nocardiopsis sp. NPDC060348]|uniref:alpha/beta hydrolase n=1 Tax=unclassified Nocardiopsis TaxID=2649073 RepID=UPI000AE3CA56